MELYPHQIDAIGRLKNGSILCGGVGSGKSLTALTYYFVNVCGGKIGKGKFKEMSNPIPLYIITTARKRDTMEWEEELIHFLLPPEGREDFVTIDSWNNIKKYVNVKDSFFIFDEQKVSGYGVWTKTFLKIVKSNKWILLSATPGDTWSDYIPVFIANGFYKNKTEFLQRHAVYDRYSKWPKIDRYIGEGRLLRLRKEILIDMDYERPTHRNVKVITTDYDTELYSMVVKKRWNIYKNSPCKNISEYYSVIRRIPNSDKSRIERVLEICESHPRVIIFYNFDYELYLLRDAKYPEGTIVSEYNGHNHEMLPDSERWVYLVNYMSGAEGWNCIKTNTIIFYSQNYSYKMLEQASGRIDRVNTPFKELYYYRLKSNAPIDRAINRALSRKQDFNEYDYERNRVVKKTMTIMREK